MKHKFKTGDGVICQSIAQRDELLRLAHEYGYDVSFPSSFYHEHIVYDGVFIIFAKENEITNPIPSEEFKGLVTANTKIKRIISLENRVKELEKAIQTTVEVKTKVNPEPKFKAWQAYKNEDGVIVICSHTNNELRGYGISRNTWHSIFAYENEFNQKATPKETKAMLRKACEIWGGEDWENVKIKKHIHDNSDCDNIGMCEVCFYNDEIWNKNGCIMHKGKWAEKLEEYQDGEKYICIYDDAKHFVLKYSKERNVLFRGEYEFSIKNFQSIEPYTPERLIELAEKF